MITAAWKYFQYEKCKFRIYRENREIVDAFNKVYVKEVLLREKQQEIINSGQSQFIKI